MAEGTKPPRNYRRPVYLVLDPSFIVDNQLYLTKNGVIIYHGDIPFQYLHIKEQLPTIACNVIHQGRGHSLPPSVTGWFMAQQHNMEPCHERERSKFYSWRRYSWWSQNHSMGVHGSTGSTKLWKMFWYTTMQREWFWPCCGFNLWCCSRRLSRKERDLRRMMHQWAIHTNSHQEEDALKKERNLKEEDALKEREEPQDVWEQQRSSSGSPESPQYDDPQQDAPRQSTRGAISGRPGRPNGEEAVNLWKQKIHPDDLEDPIVEQATKKFNLCIESLGPVWGWYCLCKRRERWTHQELLRRKSDSSTWMEPTTLFTKDSTS